MSASDRCKMAAVLVAHSSSCCRCGSPLRTPEITAYPCVSHPILAYHILSLRIPAYHDLIHQFQEASHTVYPLRQATREPTNRLLSESQS